MAVNTGELSPSADMGGKEIEKYKLVPPPRIVRADELGPWHNHTPAMREEIRRRQKAWEEAWVRYVMSESDAHNSHEAWEEASERFVMLQSDGHNSRQGPDAPR